MSSACYRFSNVIDLLRTILYFLSYGFTNYSPLSCGTLSKSFSMAPKEHRSLYDSLGITVGQRAFVYRKDRRN